MSKYPTYDDPLGMTDVGEKLRASELRTLFCVSEILRIQGYRRSAEEFMNHLRNQDSARFMLASEQVEACIRKVVQAFGGDKE